MTKMYNHNMEVADKDIVLVTGKLSRQINSWSVKYGPVNSQTSQVAQTFDLKFAVNN